MIYFNILALTFKGNLHRQMMINRTKTYDNFFRPEISDFASGLHAISLSIFLYHLEMYSQIEIVLPFRDLFLHFYPIFCEIFQTPNNNKKLQKAIKPRLCEPTKFALDTRRWHCYVILPSDGLYIKCAYGSLLQLRNITP